MHSFFYWWFLLLYDSDNMYNVLHLGNKMNKIYRNVMFFRQLNIRKIFCNLRSKKKMFHLNLKLNWKTFIVSYISSKKFSNYNALSIAWLHLILLYDYYGFWKLFENTQISMFMKYNSFWNEIIYCSNSVFETNSSQKTEFFQ